MCLLMWHCVLLLLLCQGGLFGQKPTGFGATAPAQPTTFFGQQQQQPGTGVLGAAGGGLFGAKSTAANTGFSFGQATNTGFAGEALHSFIKHLSKLSSKRRKAVQIKI